MSRLEDIPKENFFTVPEGYFDKLPEKIQARVRVLKPHRSPQYILRYSVAYALPLLIATIVVWSTTRSQPDPEAMLSSIGTEELIHYLQESEITTSEMLESVNFSGEDLEALEQEAYDLSVPDAEALRSELN